MTPPNRRFASIGKAARLAAAAALLAAGCGEKAAPQAAAVPEVTAAEVVQRDVPIGGELTATVRGFEDIEIRARIEGYLKTIDYREGTEVKKGSLLFTVDDQQYRASLAESKGALARAQASLSKADMDVRRYKPLAAERAISQAELDNAVAAERAARAQVDAAKANVDNATLNLGYTRILSPIDGLAGRAQRKVGDLVGKGEPTLLTTISSIDPIRVSVNIPEALYLRYADRLHAASNAPAASPDAGTAQGEDAGAQLVLSDGNVYPERGRLILVDRSVDPKTGTLPADLAFPNPKRILRPGLYAKLRYREEVRKGALLVPQRAVQELQGQYSVVVVNADNKAESRKVTIGPRAGGLWIIEQGVNPGDKVIVEGMQKVRDGVAVKATVVPAEAAPPPAQGPPAPAPASPSVQVSQHAQGAPAPAGSGQPNSAPAAANANSESTPSR